MLVAFELLHQSVGGEGIELFQTQNVNVVLAAFFALFEQVVVDLAGAEHDLPCLRFLAGRRRLGEDPVEGTLSRHVGQAGHRALVAQQRLRRENHQRLAEVTVDLPA